MNQARDNADQSWPKKNMGKMTVCKFVGYIERSYERLS